MLVPIISTEATPPWALSSQEANEMRARQKLWKVKFEIGKRRVICRECGDTIAVGQRLSIKHLVIAGKDSFYDLVGYVHIDRKVCRNNILVNSCIDAQVEEVEAMIAADPSLVEES